MFFGLVYFHAILSGRRKYGTIGWNVPYVFDFSDFEVSNAQLSYLMKSPKVQAHESKAKRKASRVAILEMLRFFYAYINYAGKIQRVEDQTTLKAIMEDLINEQIGFAKNLQANYDNSHFGLPNDNTEELKDFVNEAIPDVDPY